MGNAALCPPYFPYSTLLHTGQVPNRPAEDKTQLRLSGEQGLCRVPIPGFGLLQCLPPRGHGRDDVACGQEPRHVLLDRHPHHILIALLRDQAKPLRPILSELKSRVTWNSGILLEQPSYKLRGEGAKLLDAARRSNVVNHETAAGMEHTVTLSQERGLVEPVHRRRHA